MSCKVWQEVCFDQKEAFNIATQLTYSGTGTAPTWASGTYTAYGASAVSAFKDAFVAVGQGNYIFEIDDTAIKAASPDIADGKLNIPLSETDTDNDDDIYVILIASFSASFREIFKIKLINGLQNEN